MVGDDGSSKNTIYGLKQMEIKIEGNYLEYDF